MSFSFPQFPLIVGYENSNQVQDFSFSPAESSKSQSDGFLTSPFGLTPIPTHLFQDYAYQEEPLIKLFENDDKLKQKKISSLQENPSLGSKNSFTDYLPSSISSTTERFQEERLLHPHNATASHAAHAPTNHRSSCSQSLQDFELQGVTKERNNFYKDTPSRNMARAASVRTASDSFAISLPIQRETRSQRRQQRKKISESPIEPSLKSFLQSKEEVKKQKIKESFSEIYEKQRIAVADCLIESYNSLVEVVGKNKHTQSHLKISATSSPNTVRRSTEETKKLLERNLQEKKIAKKRIKDLENPLSGDIDIEKIREILFSQNNII